jgi:hypothetical protein
VGLLLEKQPPIKSNGSSNSKLHKPKSDNLKKSGEKAANGRTSGKEYEFLELEST